MLKKNVIMATFIFLLFEVLYYQSNLNVVKMKDNSNSLQVYEFTLLDKEDDFITDYSDIIIENNDDKVVILTSYQEFNKIKEKYNIKQ